MKTEVIGIFVFCFLAVACSSVPEVDVQALTPSELNGNPSRYDGQDVVVRGYVTIVPEGHHIYESKKLSDEFVKLAESHPKGFNTNSYDKYCLTIENPGAVDPSGKVLHKTMTVSGRFEAKYLHGRFIDLAACALPTAIVVKKIISAD